MKNLILLLLVFHILISCKKMDVIPSQLLKNSDLESDNLSVWKYSVSYDSFAPPIWVTEESFSPSHSLKIDRIASYFTLNTYYYYSQSYSGEMPFGEDLILTAKIKGVNLIGNGVSIAIITSPLEESGSQGQYVNSSGIIRISGTFEWTDYNITLPNLASNTSSISVRLYYLPYTLGTVYFDDITLTHY